MRSYYKGVARDQYGAIISSASIAIYLAGTTTVASVYTVSTGGTAVDSVTSDAEGIFYFYVDTSDYSNIQLFKLVISHLGNTSTYDNISVFYYDNYYIDALGEYGSGTVYTQATIESALTAIGTVNKVTLLLRPGNWVLTSDLTIPANITLKLPAGAIITIPTGKTLTIDGPFEAGLYQVFDPVDAAGKHIGDVGFDSATSGAVTFGSGSVSEVYPQWWGSSPDGATTDQKDYIQAAIDSCPIYGVVYIPDSTNYYLIDASDLTESIIVDKQITLIIDGILRIGTSAYQANPTYIISVTGDDVKLCGTGMLEGDGTYFFDNVTHTNRAYLPGLLRVNGKRIQVEGLKFKNPPTIGINLIITAEEAKISNCVIFGGLSLADIATVAVPTVHFGIQVWSTPYVKIINNTFKMDPDTGRSLEQGIFSVGSEIGMVVSENTFLNIHEHDLYLHCNNSVISNNVIRRTQIQDEQFGNAFRVDGSYNVVIGNRFYNLLKGGIICYNSYGSIITKNSLYNCGGDGIIISDLVTSEDVSYNEISYNYLEHISTLPTSDNRGIIYRKTVASGNDIYGGKIIGNTIIGYGEAGMGITKSSMVLTAPDSYFLRNFIVQSNIITRSLAFGIYLSNVDGFKILDNYIYDNPCPSFIGIRTLNLTNSDIINNTFSDGQGIPTLFYATSFTGTCSNIKHLNNTCIGHTTTNPFTLGENFGQGILGRGNRQSTDSLIGTFTMNNVNSITVNNGNILDAIPTNLYSYVVITPLNSAAATVMGSTKSLYMGSYVAGTSFTMNTADTTAVAAVDAIFAYEIIQ